MQDPVLLTDDELEFIQHLYNRPAAKQPGALSVQIDLEESLKDLLSNYANVEKLTIDARFANQRMIFTPFVSEDAQHNQHLELGTPQIFDESGTDRRAWRLPLTPPIELRNLNGSATGLLVHELSLNGLLIEQPANRKAPTQFSLLLPLGEQKPISVKGQFVRRATKRHLAYQLEAMDSLSSERLQQFLYLQHRALYPQAHPE
ncbi:PilZ domain-containing protein [Pseudomonas segetis]|uniref:PilZ domain-containing protein n=1 Tax=Pseudomonas segetis TaxID=298908 RepID=A0A239CN07_9PSED|nr:PilZ domain-containing protein [Pseudomonas segetis]SNS21329.1 PilZ domain-containing protein [Pseudomonas segetis]